MNSGPDGSALCARCGLCCDGTLHARTQVTAEEAPAVRALGLPLEFIEDRASFRQPCLMHRQHSCSVYSARPGACRAYRCAVLKAYEGGRLTFEESEQHVQRARALRQAVVAGLAADETLADMWRAIDRDWDSGRGPFGSPAARLANAQWLLAFAKLRRYLHRHFDPSR